MIHDLSNVTFIIPIRIESEDRLINCKIVLDYLKKNFETNIIIYEADEDSKIKEIVKQYDNITHIFQFDNVSIFHRTRFLNEMLKCVSTDIVVNYDIDIILPVNTYVACSKLIASGTYDLIYPYFFGDSQKQILKSGRDKLEKYGSLDVIDENDTRLYMSQYGHCQFFKTSVYKAGGRENEKFISYGPEDQERAYRFEKLGYKLHWFDSYVYHLEHYRGHNSSHENPHFNSNFSLFDYIKSLSKEELSEYYRNINQ
jgi:hypothetical protein